MTRIEDLGEYLHELGKDEEETTSESAELPEIPAEEIDFGSTDFAPTEETSFGASEEETTFTSEETTDFGSTDFGSTDFGSTDFETTEDAPLEVTPVEDAFSIEETPSFSEPIVESIPEPVEDSFFDSESEPEEEFIPEQVVSKAPEQTYKSPENFEDLKKFAENTSVSGMGAEGNPSFSVLLKNIRYVEDVNDILALMKELGLLSDPEEQIRQRLMRGHLLVPRISEYAAIFLAHKLRRFDIDIQVGLSDEIHPPKHQETPETGLVSKFTLYQNQTHHFHFDDPKLEISQIIVAATPNLEGHQVIRYLGVASEHKMLDGHIVEDEDSAEIPRYYSELAQKLKAHALKANANAVIGLNYQLTPLPTEYGMVGSKYRLSCTGNLVWVNKL
jgi:uncharacterized protein YbjQ (UPF0145 family)